MIPQLFVGTANPGKLREFELTLSPLGIEILSPVDFPELKGFDVEETGETFLENARLKAVAYAQKSGLPTLAEDSGLEITALGGMPGVHSKRFFKGSDADRCKEILKRMQGKVDRSAQFTAEMVFLDPTLHREEHFKGVVELTIADEMRGVQGFGFDPICIPKDEDQTFAELGPVKKTAYSHRGKALAQVLAFLKGKYV